MNAVALRDLLIEVLGHRPHLQGQLLTASEWRSHILTATKEHGHGNETALRPTYMTWLIIRYDSMLSRSMEVDFATDGLTRTRKYSFCLHEAKQKHASPRRPISVDGEMADALEAA